MDGCTLDKIVKFNAQASGRDKLFRLVQYSSKFIWWYLQQARRGDDWVDKLQKLSAALSTCRKFLRVGKSLDFIHSALQSLHLSDDVLRWTLTVSKLNQALYLLFDHIVLAGRIGIAKVDRDKWNQLSARFWLVTLALGMVRDLYDLAIAVRRDQRAQEAQRQKQLSGVVDPDGRGDHRRRQGGEVSTVRVVWGALADNPPLVLDLLRNACDLVLPLHALGHISASPGVQGLAGTASSLIGIATTWQPLLRLTPA